MAKAEFISKSDMTFRTDNEKVRTVLYKNYNVIPHNHDFYEINVVVKGTGIHTIEDNELKVSSGSVFVIPPMVVHGYSHTENLDVYHLLLKRELLDNADDKNNVEGFEMLTEIEPFLRQNFKESLFLKLTPGQLLEIKSELEKLDDGNIFDYSGADSIRNHVALKIVYWLSHLLTIQINSEEKKITAEKEISIISALKYIHENYKEKITIKDLCSITFMSRSTFLRSFNSLCGCSPSVYLQMYRCKKALEMMEIIKNKTFVAHECGFYDLSHMEKCIKAGKL